MAVREATIQDIDVLMEIYETARRFMVENGNPTQWPQGYPSKKILLKDMAAKQLYVYEQNGEIEGAFVFFIGEDPSYAKIDGKWLNDEPYGVIHRIASRQRVPHVGQSILNYCFTKIKNLRIDTHEDNIPMQNMLKKNGFVYVGDIELLSIHESRMAFQAVKE